MLSNHVAVRYILEGKSKSRGSPRSCFDLTIALFQCEPLASPVLNGVEVVAVVVWLINSIRSPRSAV